jgi:hypothetical protein
MTIYALTKIRRKQEEQGKEKKTKNDNTHE